MVIFSRLIPASKIIKAAEGFTSVVIVGCTGCANTNIAYEKDQPVYQFITDKTTGSTRRLPYSVMEHAGHLKKLLEEKGLKATIEIMSTVCFVTDDPELSRLMGTPSWADLDFNKRCADAEAIITLCCRDAVLGVKRRLGEGIKIIPGMRNIGSGQVLFKMDESKEFALIDKNKSTIIQGSKFS